MFRKVEDFLAVWHYETEATLKILVALTDASLVRRFHPNVRTLGRLAWHITQSIPEMGTRTGLKLAGPAEDEPIPASAAVITERYRETAESLAREVKSRWTDAGLEVEDEMYRERWPRGRSLFVISGHQAHHRGQMMVLMRLAGLPVPGVYGPTKEEWAQFGMPAQE
ncbi:MAG: DinB family protein [Longimicrobiales bacterium]|nr:DinB family protein [Longimicrobiales bacterium]